MNTTAAIFSILVALFALSLSILMDKYPNLFSTLLEKSKALVNNNCRKGNHDYKLNEYLYHEFDAHVLHCKQCGKIDEKIQH